MRGDRSVVLGGSGHLVQNANENVLQSNPVIMGASRAVPVVAQVTTVHGARDVRIYHKMAKTLALAGYRVVLIHPGDETGVSDGVDFLGLRLGPGRLRRVLLGSSRAFWAGIRCRAMVLHFHDPELIPVALLWKACGRHVVYDVHEDLPRDIQIKQWIPGFLRGAAARSAELAEALAGYCFDGVVAATAPIAARFDPARCIIAHNYPEDIHQFSAHEQPWHLREDIVVYTGLLSEARGLWTMVDAMGRLGDATSATLLLAGATHEASAVDFLHEAAKRRRVNYVGAVPRDEVVRILGTAKIGLHVVQALPHFMESVPVKLFEYMAAGLPVIISDFPSWQALVEKSACGLCVPPGNPDALAHAIDDLLSDPIKARRMGQNGRDAIEKTFNWTREGSKVKGLYERILGGVT